MRFSFLLVFLPIFAIAQANEEIPQGLWVRYKAEMKDGSRIVSRSDIGTSFLKYDFKNDGFVRVSSDPLFADNNFKYNLHEDTIIIGPVSYVMERLARDTFRLIQAVKDVDDSKIMVFYFEKIQNAKLIDKSFYDNVLRDSVYKATNFLFPQCKDEQNKLLEMLKAGSEKDPAARISFIIDKAGLVKEFQVKNQDSLGARYAVVAKKAFEYMSWTPATKSGVPVN